MGTISIQALTTAGLLPTFATVAVAGGDQFLNNGHTFLYVKTTAAATNSVLVASQVSPVPKGLVAVNVTVEVSALGEKLSGFFDQGAYNDSSGYCIVSYGTHTGITIAAISVT